MSSLAEGEPETLQAEGEPEGMAEGLAEGTAEGLAEGVSEYEPETEPSWEPASEGAAVGEVSSEAMFYSTLVLYSLTILLILALNLPIVVAVLKGKLHKSNVINIYLLSLIISRMCIGVLVIPARITGLFSEEYLGVFLCKLCHFFAMGSSATSVFSTAAISIVKFREIVLHKGNISITQKKAVRDVLIIWTCGHLYAIRAPVMNSLIVQDGFYMCTVTPDYKTLDGYLTFLDLFVLFVAPLCIVVFCYINVIGYLTQSRKTNTEKPVKDAWTTDKKEPLPSSEEEKARQKEEERMTRKSIEMILAVLTLFFVCTIFPYFPKLYAMFSPNLFDDFNVFETSCYLISYSNPWINAIVILGFRADIRRALRLICACRGSKVANEESIKSMLNSLNLQNRDILLRTD